MVSGGTPEDQDDYSVANYLAAGVFAIVVAYFAFAFVQFSRLPQSRRTLTNFLLPFGPSESARELHQKGVDFYRSRQYRKAIGAFKRSLDRNPGNAKGIFLLASSLARLGRYQVALTLYDKAKTVDPTFARTYIRRAYLLLGLGKYGEASGEADQFLDLSEVPDRNKIYGYLVKIAAGKLDGDTTNRTERLLERAKNLKVGPESFPRSLLDVTAGNRSLDSVLDNKTLSLGDETELKTWAALRYYADGDSQRARELLDWVLRQGDKTRYEYDLARSFNQTTGGGLR